MGNIKLEERVADREILERNKIFLKEANRVLEAVTKEIVLVQHIALGRFALTHGLMNGVAEYNDGHGYLAIGQSTTYWLNEGVLEIGQDDKQGIPFGYNDCDVGRVVNCKKKVIYGDEEVMKRWNEDFLKWRKKLSHYKRGERMEINNIFSPLHVYGIEVPYE